MKLTHFWIRFRSNPGHNPSRLGCGVTAYSYDDALATFRRKNRNFAPESSYPKQYDLWGKDLPPVDEVIENVDVSSLDQKHVVPNMEPRSGGECGSLVALLLLGSFQPRTSFRLRHPLALGHVLNWHFLAVRFGRTPRSEPWTQWGTSGHQRPN
jgi:hypothetical protein